MSNTKVYKCSGYIVVDVEDVCGYLEEKDDRELPENYEPTDDEWDTAAYNMLMDGDIPVNIEEFKSGV